MANIIYLLLCFCIAAVMVAAGIYQKWLVVVICGLLLFIFFLGAPDTRSAPDLKIHKHDPAE